MLFSFYECRPVSSTSSLSQFPYRKSVIIMSCTMNKEQVRPACKAIGKRLSREDKSELKINLMLSRCYSFINDRIDRSIKSEFRFRSNWREMHRHRCASLSTLEKRLQAKKRGKKNLTHTHALGSPCYMGKSAKRKQKRSGNAKTHKTRFEALSACDPMCYTFNGNES